MAFLGLFIPLIEMTMRGLVSSCNPWGHRGSLTVLLILTIEFRSHDRTHVRRVQTAQGLTGGSHGEGHCE